MGFAAGDMNVNRYVANSPVNFVDPSGWVVQELGLLPVDWGFPTLFGWLGETLLKDLTPPPGPADPLEQLKETVKRNSIEMLRDNLQEPVEEIFPEISKRIEISLDRLEDWAKDNSVEAYSLAAGFGVAVYLTGPQIGTTINENVNPIVKGIGLPPITNVPVPIPGPDFSGPGGLIITIKPSMNIPVGPKPASPSVGLTIEGRR